MLETFDLWRDLASMFESSSGVLLLFVLICLGSSICAYLGYAVGKHYRDAKSIEADNTIASLRSDVSALQHKIIQLKSRVSDANSQRQKQVQENQRLQGTIIQLGAELRGQEQSLDTERQTGPRVILKRDELRPDNTNKPKPPL